MKLAALLLAGASGIALGVRKAYERGRAAGALAGFEEGDRHGFRRGLTRGIVISTAAFGGASLQRPIPEDLTLGGRLEERRRESAARKPS